jgi:hypothetical protein
MLNDNLSPTSEASAAITIGLCYRRSSVPGCERCSWILGAAIAQRSTADLIPCLGIPSIVAVPRSSHYRSSSRGGMDE